MRKYIFHVLFLLSLIFLNGCYDDVMEKMQEGQDIENGVWDVTLWDQSRWTNYAELDEDEP